MLGTTGEPVNATQQDNFDKAFEHVIGVEGKYSHNIYDSGGATMYGITQDTLSSFRGKPVTVNDVKNLSLHEAKLIYRARYWNPLNCANIKSGVLATILFDQGVNRGIVTSAKSIQYCVGTKEDGMIGDKTIAAINELASRDLAMKFIFQAQEAYARIVQHNVTQSVFLVGWLRRTHKLFELVLKA